MSVEKKLQRQRKVRAYRVRNKFASRGLKHRISVFRSLNQIYAQIIDDSTSRTLVSFSSVVLKDSQAGERLSKTAVAKQVGLELGKLAQGKSIESVFFDRGRCLYHGRVRALAQGLRESGLKF